MSITQKIRSCIAMAATAVTLSGATAQAGSASDWNGFYAGAFAGAVLGSNQFEERSVPGQATPGDWKNTPVGITLGYNHKFGSNIVAGAELDYAFGDTEATSVTSGNFGCPATGCVTTLDHFATIRGRVGYDFGKILAFGSIGYGRGKAQGSAAGFPNVGRNTLYGLVWGFGLEFMIANNLTFKTEYLNSDLGRLELPNGCATNCFTDVEFEVVRFGLNYQF